MKFFALLVAVALACNSTALVFQTTQPYASEQVQTVELKKIAKVKAEVEKGGIGQGAGEIAKQGRSQGLHQQD